MSAAKQSKRNQAKQVNTVKDWYQSTGRRWGRNLLVLIFAVAVFVPGLGLLLERLEPKNLPISSIEIRGDLERVDVDAVKAVVGPLVSGGVLHADVHDLAALVGQQPWVERAWVRKRWPDTLEIQLAAYEPVARWGEDAWLDVNGVVFTGSKQPDQARFDVLHAPAGLERKVLDAYGRYQAALQSVGIDLAAIEVDQRRAWRIRTKQQFSIELGREDMDRRLWRFVSVYPGELNVDKRTMLQADMRYPHGLAVHWQSETEALNPAEKAVKG